MVDLERSIEELENNYWGPAQYPSHLVTTVHYLRTIPLRALTIEHLRIAIGQKMSLPILIPMALSVLRKDPLASGDFFPGDLLKNLLQCASDADAFSETENEKLVAVCRAAALRLDGSDEDDEGDAELSAIVSAYLHGAAGGA